VALWAAGVNPDSSKQRRRSRDSKPSSLVT
jgi:hypothetical protein